MLKGGCFVLDYELAVQGYLAQSNFEQQVRYLKHGALDETGKQSRQTRPPGSSPDEGVVEMSWRTINIILGIAATDPDFFEDLKRDPQEAVSRHGLDLTPQELNVLKSISATGLAEFSQELIDKLGPESNNP